MNTRTKSRDEHGAVAVLVALVCIALLMVGAIAVDMGQVYAKRSALQSNVDLSVLAAAAEKEQSGVCSDLVKDKAVEYLNDPTNRVDGQALVTSGDLTDLNSDNGEITCPGWRVKLTAPEARVDFGFAEVFGTLTNVDVPAYAEAMIGTPGGAPAPFFIPSQCAWRLQVIKAGAQPPEATPQYPASDPDVTGADQQNVPDPSTIDPLEVGVENPPTDPKPSIQVAGARLSGATAVSFTRADKTFYSRLTPLDPPVAGEGAILPPITDEVLTVEVPDGVVRTEGNWYIRVQNSVGWSDSSHAPSFSVVTSVDPFPGCGEKNEGDFGLLDSPRDGYPAGQQQQRLEANIEFGIDHELEPWNPWVHPTIDKACKPAATPVAGAKLDDTGFPQGTPPNCVNILNGNKIEMVTDGLVDRLSKVPTADGCSPTGGDDELSLVGTEVNNDVLSCYILGGYSVDDVWDDLSPAAEVIDPEIFNSPRFLWLPVIANPIAPSNGFYPIIEWRPAFITDEGSSASKGDSNATPLNGIALDNSGNKVAAIWIVAINPASLPKSAPNYSGPLGPYLPGTTKVIRLVK